MGGATHLSYLSLRNVIIYLLLLLEWSTTYIYALLKWGYYLYLRFTGIEYYHIESGKQPHVR